MKQLVFSSGIIRGHIVRSTYFDNGLYDGLELTTIGWERSVKIAIDSQGSMYSIILRNHY